MNIPALNKAVKSIADYFDTSDADAISLASRLRMAPEGIQAKVFDFCICFIQDVAESDVYDVGMQINQKIARDLLNQ